jgi:hypothetical protein
LVDCQTWGQRRQWETVGQRVRRPSSVLQPCEATREDLVRADLEWRTVLDSQQVRLPLL